MSLEDNKFIVLQAYEAFDLGDIEKGKTFVTSESSIASQEKQAGICLQKLS